MPNGTKVTQLFFHIRHLHPAPSCRLYLLAAAYLSFEGFDMKLGGGDVDVGLPISLKLCGSSPRKVCVGVVEDLKAPSGWSDEGIVEPDWEWSRGFFIFIEEGFDVKIPNVRLLVWSILFGEGGDLSVGKALDPMC
jgi:hypothetical protein